MKVTCKTWIGIDCKDSITFWNSSSSIIDLLRMPHRRIFAWSSLKIDVLFSREQSFSCLPIFCHHLPFPKSQANILLISLPVLCLLCLRQSRASVSGYSSQFSCLFLSSFPSLYMLFVFRFQSHHFLHLQINFHPDKNFIVFSCDQIKQHDNNLCNSELTTGLAESTSKWQPMGAVEKSRRMRWVRESRMGPI